MCQVTEAAERDSFMLPFSLVPQDWRHRTRQLPALTDTQSWVSLAAASRQAVTVESKLDQLGIK